MTKKKINLKIKQDDGSFEHLIPITNMDAVMDVNDEKTLTEVLENDYATKQYVDESVVNLVNSAPETLDTLNELATALGNDENFATNVTNNIANKVNKPEVNGTEGQVLSLDGQGNTVWADAGIDEDELNNMLTDTFGFSENE